MVLPSEKIVLLETMEVERLRLVDVAQHLQQW